VHKLDAPARIRPVCRENLVLAAHAAETLRRRRRMSCPHEMPLSTQAHKRVRLGQS
jgi:hypothetical protein